VRSPLLSRAILCWRSSYSASKHALHGFFDSLLAEHHQDGLRVTIVCPGFVRTEVSRSALTGDGSPHATMDEAIERGISAHECAEGVLDTTARARRGARRGSRAARCVPEAPRAAGVLAADSAGQGDVREGRALAPRLRGNPPRGDFDRRSVKLTGLEFPCES